MTGSTIASLKRNVLDDLYSMFGIDTQLNQSNEFKMFGNTIACFGADKVDSYKPMKGFTAFGWYANEVTEHHINSVDQAFKRCSGEGSRMFWDTNPSGPAHFIKTNYIDKDGQKIENQLFVKSWHFVLDDNTFLDRNYVESLKRAIPSGVWYDRDILGLWVAAEGMIYRDFSFDENVLETVLGGIKEYIAGVDWGFEHKGVIGVYGIDYDGNAIRLKEIVETQKTIDFWKREASSLMNEFKNIKFYCDPARPDYIADFRNSGIPAMEADNSVVEGITFIAELFKKRQLFIIKHSNKNYLQEIYNYRWRDHSSREEPIKEMDDSMDSERYALYSHLRKNNIVTVGLNLYR